MVLAQEREQHHATAQSLLHLGPIFITDLHGDRGCNVAYCALAVVLELRHFHELVSRLRP